MISPRHLDRIKFTDHAKQKIKNRGIDIDLVFGRTINLHGYLYRDRENNNFELFLEDRELVVVFDTKFLRYYKTAVVRTVFSNKGYSRYKKSRYKQLDAGFSRIDREDSKINRPI